jgi:hypothetical protein
MKTRSMDGSDVYLISLVALLMSDLWMWGITPPPAIVAFARRAPENETSAS